MALACPPTTAARTGLLSLKFNQDQSCLTMATAKGFRVWNADPFTLRYERDLGGGTGLATVLFRSNIVALVGGGPNPRFRNDRVMLWDDCRNQSIAELCFNSTVRGVEMVRDAIAIALDERVYIYALANLDLVKRVPTVNNPRGLVDIRASEGGTDNVIATLSTKAGYVEIHHSDNRVCASSAPFVCLSVCFCFPQVCLLGPPNLFFPCFFFFLSMHTMAHQCLPVADAVSFFFLIGALF